MRRTFIPFLLIATMTLAGPAHAQLQCEPRSDVVSKLETVHGKTRAALGVGEHGRQVLELFVDAEARWTILITRPNGLSCVAASGDSWTVIGTPAGQDVAMPGPAKPGATTRGAHG